MISYFLDFEPILVIYIILVLLFNQYAEEHYGTLSERIFKLFHYLSLFRIIRYSFITNIIFLIFHYWQKPLIKYSIYNNAFLNTCIKSLYTHWLIYSLAFIMIALLIYVIRKKQIKKNLLLHFESKLNIVYHKFILYILLKSVLILGIFILVKYFIELIDFNLFNLKIYPNTFFENQNELVSNIDTAYRRGIYQSLFITILTLLFLLNVLLKRIQIGIIDRAPIFILSILVTCGGIYSGCYAIFNTYFNLKYKTFPNWTDEDKLLGHYSLKITALLLLCSLIIFIFKHVYGGSFKLVLKYGILPSKPSSYEAYRLERTEYDISSRYSRYFFAQVGFYVLNIFIAEILIISVAELKWIFIFFSLFPIIVDDYLVIHYYFEKGNEMYWWHRFKKEFFNFALFSLSLFLLISNDWWILLSIYTSFAIILYSIYPGKFSINNEKWLTRD